MNIVDLQRIQVMFIEIELKLKIILFATKADKASACLIIAIKECPDSDNDDSSNIMRVISLKNVNPCLRILLQLLRYHHKVRRDSFSKCLF
jgi:hypothetical protein